jgi:hypothetical protein
MWHGAIIQTDAALWRALPVPSYSHQTTSGQILSFNCRLIHCCLIQQILAILFSFSHKFSYMSQPEKKTPHFTPLELKENLSATLEVGEQVSEFVNLQSNWNNK